MTMRLLVLASIVAVATAVPDYPKIRDLQQTGSTLTSVTLSWTLDASEFVPINYILVIDGNLTINFFYDGSNTYTATGLQSCKQYTFELTADYDEGPGETAGTPGITDYETPPAVTDLTVSGSVVSWTAPNNGRCVDSYRVCYLSAVTGDSDCTEDVTSTSYDLGVLSDCDELDITVEAVGGGNAGEASTVHLTTEDGVPGMVTDLEVVCLNETGQVQVSWNPPLENPACVCDYAIVYGPVNNFTATKISNKNKDLKTEDDEDDDEEDGMAEGPSGQTETAILEDPLLCDDYRIGVATVSCDGDYSDAVVVYLSTNDSCDWCSPSQGFSLNGSSDEVVEYLSTNGSAPGPVQNLALEDVQMTSLTVTYDAPLDNPECVEMYVVTYVNTLDVLDTKSTDTRAGFFTAFIDGLDACATYDIGVSAVSTIGIEGPVTHSEITLKQVSPDPPSEGTLVSRTDTSLTVLWLAPTDMRFCVDIYEVKLIREGSEHTHLVPVPQYNLQMLETFSGLDPCTSYHVEIRAGNSDTSGHSLYNTVLNDARTLCPLSDSDPN